MKMFMFQHQTPGIVENSREGKARTCRPLQTLSYSNGFPFYALCVVTSSRGISVVQKEHRFQAFWSNSAKTWVVYLCPCVSSGPLEGESFLCLFLINHMVFNSLRKMYETSSRLFRSRSRTTLDIMWLPKGTQRSSHHFSQSSSRRKKKTWSGKQ